MGDQSKDMIIQVYLVCLTHYEYYMLISQMKVVMKGNYHLNLKILGSCLYKDLISYYLWYYLWTNDDLKVIHKGTLV